MTRSVHTGRENLQLLLLWSAVAAGSGGLDDVPFRTTSAQEDKLETGMYCGTSCCRLGGDPAGKTAPTTLPVSGGAEPRGEVVRWRGVWRGVAGNVDRPSGSALQLPSPPGVRVTHGCRGVGHLPSL